MEFDKVVRNDRKEQLSLKSTLWFPLLLFLSLLYFSIWTNLIFQYLNKTTTGNIDDVAGGFMYIWRLNIYFSYGIMSMDLNG